MQREHLFTCYKQQTQEDHILYNQQILLILAWEKVSKSVHLIRIYKQRLSVCTRDPTKNRIMVKQEKILFGRVPSSFKEKKREMHLRKQYSDLLPVSQSVTDKSSLS
jgi:hypothetical protein